MAFFAIELDRRRDTRKYKRRNHSPSLPTSITDCLSSNRKGSAVSKWALNKQKPITARPLTNPEKPIHHKAYLPTSRWTEGEINSTVFCSWPDDASTQNFIHQVTTKYKEIQVLIYRHPGISLALDGCSLETDVIIKKQHTKLLLLFERSRFRKSMI